MRTKLFVLLFALLPLLSMAELTKQEEIELVKQFIDRIKHDKIDELSQHVQYPLSLSNPLPDIKDSQDFKYRYKDIFDRQLIDEIITSNPAKDWSAMGWRGIMLNDGTLWIDSDGKLSAINYLSTVEKQKRQQLIAKDKNSVHLSIREFYEPVCIIETDRFIIRVDEIEYNTGMFSYRYASWSKGKLMSEKPDLVLSGGELVFDGTGGNHHYLFKNGECTYQCMINVIRATNTPEATLILTKNDKIILSQGGKIRKNESREIEKALTEEELTDNILSQLKLKQTDIQASLFSIKPMPYDKAKSVVVLPKIVYYENDNDFELDAYILVVDNADGKILSTFYESKAWISDAVKLVYISIDFAPYKLNARERAFGIRVNYIGSSRTNPYSSEELSLFTPRENMLERVLSKFEVSSSSGDWDTNCEGNFTDTKTVLMLSSKSTNGYFDIVAKSKIEYTRQFMRNDDCSLEESVENKTVTLKFDGEKYQ